MLVLLFHILCVFFELILGTLYWLKVSCLQLVSRACCWLYLVFAVMWRYGFSRFHHFLEIQVLYGLWHLRWCSIERIVCFGVLWSVLKTSFGFRICVGKMIWKLDCLWVYFGRSVLCVGPWTELILRVDHGVGCVLCVQTMSINILCLFIFNLLEFCLIFKN